MYLCVEIKTCNKSVMGSFKKKAGLEEVLQQNEELDVNKLFNGNGNLYQHDPVHLLIFELAV